MVLIDPCWLCLLALQCWYTIEFLFKRVYGDGNIACMLKHLIVLMLRCDTFMLWNVHIKSVCYIHTAYNVAILSTTLIVCYPPLTGSQHMGGLSSYSLTLLNESNIMKYNNVYGHYITL